MVVLLWRVFGVSCVAVGTVGVFVPLLPTTPFLLVAAWAFARGSERWRRWLVEHPRFGPAIDAWQRSGAISVRGKGLAILSLGLSMVLALWLNLPPPALLLQVVAVVAVTVFILSRPTAR